MIVDSGCEHILYLQVLDINALMVLAIAGALAIGDYTEGAAIVVLFAIASWLEAGCGRRARDAVAAVIAMQPATATLTDTGEIRLMYCRCSRSARLMHPFGDRLWPSSLIPCLLHK